jgi:DNA-binding transcriptional LysR family regulator
LAHCEATELWPVELVAIVPVDFAAAMKRGLTVESLGDMTVFAQDTSMWSRRQLDALAQKAKVRLNIVTEPLPEVCVSLARAGLGVAVVASDNVNAEDADVLTIVDAKRSRVEDSIKANWLPENDNPRLQAFVAYLKDS